MTNDYMITMDSFGSECPANWEEIANYLNDIIDTYIAEATSIDEDGIEYIDMEDEFVLRDKIAALWESYCAGDIADAPTAHMAIEKTIWVARVADDNSDAYRAYFTEAEARNTANGYKAKLTPSEQRRNTVTVESYHVTIDDADTRTAEEIYRDLLDEDADEIANPDTYYEV